VFVLKEYKMSVTTRACMIYFTRCRLSDYMFLLSSLGHHQIVSLYRGNYTMYDLIQYVKFYYYFTRSRFCKGL